MLCSMAPVGLPLLRAFPREAYTKPFAERSSKQHDYCPSQDRSRDIMAPMDYAIRAARAVCGLGDHARHVLCRAGVSSERQSLA